MLANRLHTFFYGSRCSTDLNLPGHILLRKISLQEFIVPRRSVNAYKYSSLCALGHIGRMFGLPTCDAEASIS